MKTETTASGAVGLGRGGRLSRKRKRDAVLRLLRGGKPVDTLAGAGRHGRDPDRMAGHLRGGTLDISFQGRRHGSPKALPCRTDVRARSRWLDQPPDRGLAHVKDLGGFLQRHLASFCTLARR